MMRAMTLKFDWSREALDSLPPVLWNYGLMIPGSPSATWEKTKLTQHAGNLGGQMQPILVRPHLSKWLQA